jgi:hypothetical protein
MEIFTASILLATEVFRLVNTKESQKYLDRAVSLELELVKELDKPYGKQNDKKVVRLKKELAVILRAAIAEAKNARGTK